MKAIRLALLSVVALFGLAQAVCAQPIKVGSITDARFNDQWTLDGSEMQNTRAKLLNPANFGPAGTVKRPIVITDTAATPGSVTAELLAPFDVFFIGYLNDGSDNAFTAEELAAFATWVNAGGTMVITCDESGYDAVCAHFGYPAADNGPSKNPILPTAAGAAHPLFNGPFGVIPSVNMNGTKGAFTATAGATILALDSTPGTPLPTVLVKNVGLGRIILMADVDLLANAATDGDAITNNNDRFIGNVFAFAAGVPFNYQGLWWNPQESGWGINFAHQGNVVFATWFTFGPDNKPQWYTVVAQKASTYVFSGAVSSFTGPPFSSQPFPANANVKTPVGTATITFSADGKTASFAYTVNGIAQTKQIVPQQFGAALPTCVWGAQPDLTLATNFQDIWWVTDGLEAGWGINFTHQGNIIFATWFTYDATGKALWVFVVAQETAVPKVYSGPLKTATGPVFSAVPFDPDAVIRTEVGNASITVSDGNHARFDYTLNGITQSKNLVRQVFAAPGTVCQ